MKKNYEPSEFESKWQKKWQENGLYDIDFSNPSDKKTYSLTEFPYPSGNLHVGHWYAFAIPDIRVRYLRMNGYQVFYPIGFDSFGLPAENAAIKYGKNPKAWTDGNIEFMTKQLERMGASFSWKTAFRTSDPAFYKWTQWMFGKFYEKGLVYRDLTLVNWCPSCKTVLANEQVVQGKCERCDSDIERKDMYQWMLRITDYADRLIDNLDGLDWPQEIKEAQKNWIGKSHGAEFYFEIDTNKKLHFVLVHGYKSGPDKNFYGWLRSELEKRGHTVEVPALPNPANPDVLEQARYVTDHCQINENTVLVGHSLGTNVVLRVLESIQNPVKETILIAGFISGDFLDNKKRDFDFDFDFEKVKQNAGSIIIVHDKNEKTISLSQFQKLKNTFSEAYVVLGDSHVEHFRDEVEPALLRAVLPFVPVFTTRADTLYGVTYLVISPEHKLLSRLLSDVSNKSEVLSYVKQAGTKTDLERQQSKEKTGCHLRGLAVLHPDTGERLSIWVADYVLADYGTGAIMAVPAHDDRDLEFAQVFDLPIREVVDVQVMLANDHNPTDLAGLSLAEAKTKIIAKMSDVDRGKAVTMYKQRDWGISRQRYWGTPIPVVYDPEGRPHIVPEEHLPWELPTDVDFTPDGTAPLARSKELLERVERIFGTGWKPEVDTMDAFVDSTWYFIRYLNSENESQFVDKKIADKWLPVDYYCGGSEHTTMHLLYARFWYMVLADMNLVPKVEPFTKRLNRGLILGPDGKKMSKSKGNVVDPDKEVEKFGADSIRAYLSFIGPYNEPGHYPWNVDGLVGVRRFLEKVWRLASNIKPEDNPELNYVLHFTIQKVADDLERYKTNTAVAQLMVCVNAFEKAGSVGKSQYLSFLKVLAPVAPHITEELWHLLGEEGFIHEQSWPLVNQEFLQKETVEVVVQVNGKVRAKLQLPYNSTEEYVKEQCFLSEKASLYLSNQAIKKVIYIPNRLINFVI